MPKNNKLTLEEAVLILDSYLLNARYDGDDVSMEQSALARILDELGEYDIYE